MLQQSFPAEIANIITGIIVYGSGLTTFLIYVANKYWFKNKKRIHRDSNLTTTVDQNNTVASIDLENSSQIEDSNNESEDIKEGGN